MINVNKSRSQNLHKILIVAAKDFKDSNAILCQLDQARDYYKCELAIIIGGNYFSDGVCRTWCQSNGIALVDIPIHWEKLGKTAGIIRSEWIFNLLNPETVLTFGEDGLTRSCTSMAILRNVQVCKL